MTLLLFSMTFHDFPGPVVTLSRCLPFRYFPGHSGPLSLVIPRCYVKRVKFHLMDKGTQKTNGQTDVH